MPEVITILFMSVALAMDAFAVSICNGLTKKLSFFQSVLSSAVFGVFQGVMPLLGYLLGRLFLPYIEDYDHWIAFALLLIIGGKMVLEGAVALKKGQQLEQSEFKLGQLLLQGIATSIDALAVGISLIAFTLSIYLSAAVIASVTFAICLVGVFLGDSLNKLLKGKTQVANIIGGIVLVGIGVKILIEHLVA